MVVAGVVGPTGDGQGDVDSGWTGVVSSQLSHGFVGSTGGGHGVVDAGLVGWTEGHGRVDSG